MSEGPVYGCLAAIVLVSSGAASAQGDHPISRRYLDCLERFQDHARTIWHESDEAMETQPGRGSSAASPGSGYFGDGGSGGNGGIRGTCGVLLSYATLLRAGRGDRDELVGALRKGLRYAALTHRVAGHKCRDGKQWGGSWQSALWSGSLGFAAALSADCLEPGLVEACKRVVAYEADRLVKIPPPSGWKGDSKAEENGWNSNALALAGAWMSDDPRAGDWIRAAKAYLVNTYTVPDCEDDPLAEWVTTTRLYPSFICENHGFFHPSYQMVSGMSMGDSLLMAKAINPAVAEELRPFAEHNVLPVWRRLMQVLLSDSGELAYPSGLDWSLHGYGQISYLAWLARHFGEPVGRWAEDELSARLAERQEVNGDGRFTGDSVPNGFYREAVMARRVSMGWWQRELGDASDGPISPPEDFVAHIPDAKLLLQRTRSGFASLSYGARVMAYLAPGGAQRGETPYVTTPRFPGIIGRGAFGDPTAARARDVRTLPNGFEATLEVDFAPLETRLVRIVSYEDCFVIVEAPTGAPLLDGELAAFPVGIENHALTGGSRELDWGSAAHTARAMSGERIDVPGSWVRISGRLGYIAGPEGQIGYHTAGGYNRRGAAEDHVQFVPAGREAPRYAILLPGHACADTDRVAESVRWEVADGRATLKFANPPGVERTVRLDLPQAGDAGRELVHAASVMAGSESTAHPAGLVIDGDPVTFWVSSRDGSAPGHGPTPERPEWLEFTFEDGAEISEVIIVPRARYGPKDILLALDGVEVHSGRMGHGPVRVALDQPATTVRARLTMTSSYDPRHPDNPRNVQVAEVLFAHSSPAAGGGEARDAKP